MALDIKDAQKLCEPTGDRTAECSPHLWKLRETLAEAIAEIEQLREAKHWHAVSERLALALDKALSLSAQVVAAVADERDRACAEAAQLRLDLAEVLNWCEPFGAGRMPPDSISELRPTKMRAAGVDRATRLAALKAKLP